MDFSLKRIAYGQYAQVHDGTDNTAKLRSVYGIAMYQKNEREGYAFMNLDTGNLIHSNTWTPLPITQQVIERVETIAKEMINVNELIEDIDKLLNNKIMRHVQRQEDPSNKNNNNEAMNEEASDNIEQPEQQHEQEQNGPEEQQNNNEQPREYNRIPIVDPDMMVEESDDIGIILQIDDLSQIDQISDSIIEA